MRRALKEALQKVNTVKNPGIVSKVGWYNTGEMFTLYTRGVGLFYLPL